MRGHLSAPDSGDGGDASKEMTDDRDQTLESIKMEGELAD